MSGVPAADDGSGGHDVSSVRVHKPPRELLDDGGWFPVPNSYVDMLMAQLHPHDFVVLLIIRRLSYGLQRRTARVSQEHIASLSGLPRRSVQRALTRLKRDGHLVVVDPGVGRRSSTYQLSADLEISLAESLSYNGVTLSRLSDAITEKEPVVASESPLRVDSVTPLSGQGGAATSTPKDKSLKTNFPDGKEIIRSPLSQLFTDRWPAIRQDLRGQLTEATFASCFWNAKPRPTSDGELILEVGNESTAAWIRARLMRPLLSSLRTYVSEDLDEDSIKIVADSVDPAV